MSSYTSTNSNNNSNNNNNNNNNANTSNTQNNSSNTSASRTTGETHSASRGPLLSMEQQDGRDGLAKNLANKDTRNLMITMGKSSKRNRGKSTGSELLILSLSKQRCAVAGQFEQQYVREKEESRFKYQEETSLRWSF
ncbi:hypothetical protein IWX47DRAFT_843622 [Phyllosticta citricarpa]